MEIVKIKIKDIIPYSNNAKQHPREQIEQIKLSIEQFGNNDPIAVDENNIIIEGHGRLIALNELGYEEADCIILDGLNDEQKMAYRLVHNQLTMNTDWDVERLKEELSKISLDMNALGLTVDDLDEVEKELRFSGDGQNGSLSEKYICPPFSVLNAQTWVSRKQVWKSKIKSEIGREGDLLGAGLRELAENSGGNYSNGTSIFDPVLCEILINWFCPKNGRILDVFAGGSVRGLISSYLDREYTGIDLRQEQIDANYENYEELRQESSLYGNPLIKPHWICNDSLNVDTLVEDDSFDMLLTCPPYADLEVYSDDPRDISTMDYNDFLETYTEIFRRAYPKLKENAFACVVVGEVRENHFGYRNFVGDTVEALKKIGFVYYNEIILINAYGTAALRANRQFSASRKVIKVHQNVLVFVKGDPRKIELEEVDYDFDELAEEEI